MSSRERAPSSVYQSANEVREPPHVGKSRVKGGVAAFERRPWVGATQGRRQREDRLHRRVDVKHCCTWGAVEWTWDAVVLVRQLAGAAAEGATLRERHRLDSVLRRFLEAPKVRHK